MGMGEPLHSYDAVMTATEILCDSAGLSLGTKQITLSTVGVVPGIRRLADEGRPIHLAVSLHGATQAERAALVPVAKKWPLDELMDACRYYIAKQQRRIFYEWTLIERKNDSADHAHAVGRLLHGQNAQVNLIPLNPTPADLPALVKGLPLVRQSGKPFSFVLARVRPNLKNNDGAAMALEALGLVLPSRMHERVIYAETFAHGKTALEIDPKGVAAQEVAALWQAVKARLEENENA